MRVISDVISSTHNDIVKRIIDIKNNPSNMLFIENIKLIDEALKSGREVIFSLICSDYLDVVKSTCPEVLESDYYIVSRPVLEKICDTRSPQGIASVIRFDMLRSDISGKFIVLDNIQDPGNLGTIIRSASGTDFNDICLINGAYPLNQKVVRSTMGGIFRTRFHLFSSPSEFVDYAKEHNLTYYSCSMEGDNVFSFKPTGDFGIVIGNEGNGVSDILKQNSSKLLSIPMKNGLESLNAGVSLGIIIYYLQNM